MIDDPWVWEDFGGPIPCDGAFDEPVTTGQDSVAGSGGPAARQDYYAQTQQAYSQAIITWAQMEAADLAPSDPTIPPAHERLEGFGEPLLQGSSALGQGSCTLGGGATAPGLGLRFAGAARSDAAQLIPPDTMGAVGPRHFMQVVNGFVGVYDKATGRRMRDVRLRAFFSGTPGSSRPFDPRVLFDQHAGRWIVAAAKGSNPHNLIVLAVSLSDDPTGAWFQTSYISESTTGFADYPTLGVDARGIYVASNDPIPDPSPTDELWAVEKAPLIAQPPYAGFVKHWAADAPSSPLISVEVALQPAHTYGDPGRQYLIQTAKNSNSALEIYQVEWAAVGPVCATLTFRGTVDVDDFSEAPNAPALESTTNIDTLDPRLMMAVYRDGFLWTCHTVNHTGADQINRAACRWYKINPAMMTVDQCGLVAGTSLHYYYPSLMVNSGGDVVMGFSGSDATQYVAAYFTGRSAAESTLDMAPPVLLKLGEASYTVLDVSSRNRWGDYSYTTLDPVDQTTFWTIQEYAGADGQEDQWGTWVGQLRFGVFDCDNDGTSDAAELAACGAPCDCNGNGKPDNCEPDCNGNGTADACEIPFPSPLDCNSNGVPDACDLAGETSQDDCNGGNGRPDECDFVSDCNANCTEDDQETVGGAGDCNLNGTPDSCEATDCNANTFLDACDISMGTSTDCDLNQVPDDCEPDCDDDGAPDLCEPNCNQHCYPDDCDLTAGTSQDCDDNQVPDECDPDCNANAVPDACDITSGTSQDCNTDGTPDECGIDCNQNGFADSCDVASGTSPDCNTNTTAPVRLKSSADPGR